ncbi:MAG: hypothetical protein KIS76_12785 [Pyrinomonadaceae bacterium]|nr:hypothetical protein [Pyrinomonadaceae bacterium]
MRVSLEKYRGNRSRFTCPSCGHKYVFVRYIGDDGKYVDETVGRCNRESKCGYHYPPKGFFRDNPGLKGERQKRRQNGNYGFAPVKEAAAKAELPSATLDNSYIPYDLFEETLRGYESDAFVHFLKILFPHSLEQVEATLKRYFIGSYQDYTCFPYIDQANRICRGKLIRFDRRSGKRLKEKYDTHSLVAKLRSAGKLPGDFNYKQTFFGEHLLPDSARPAAIVESEKSAVVGAICLPEFDWLAVGSKQSLKAEKLMRLENRRIILYPDADGYELWQQVASEARRNRISISVSDLIEKQATRAQKQDGCDVADYLINEQIERLEAYQEFVEIYNAKLSTVLNDESLLDDFETIIEEQKSILIMNGGLTDLAAEREVTQLENVRRIVLSL